MQNGNKINLRSNWADYIYRQVHVYTIH